MCPEFNGHIFNLSSYMQLLISFCFALSQEKTPQTHPPTTNTKPGPAFKEMKVTLEMKPSQ